MRLATFAIFTPGRELELVAGDVRAGDRADDLGLDAEMAERLDEARGGLLLAGGVGADLLGRRALEDARLGEGEVVVGDGELEVELLRGRPSRGAAAAAAAGRGLAARAPARARPGSVGLGLGLGLRRRRPVTAISAGVPNRSG